jgi:hypothetical protein
MNLAEMPETSLASLTCGCRIQRLGLGQHGYIRIGVTLACGQHSGYQDQVRSLDAQQPIHDFEPALLPTPRRAVALGGLK